jgi:hypothetical protein
LSWNRLSSLRCRIFYGEPDPLRRKMLKATECYGKACAGNRPSRCKLWG